MAAQFDLVCLSHLRWDFVYQRPQHLMSRHARTRHVFFVEEPLPLPEGETSARLDVREVAPNLRVVVPRLPEGLAGVDAEAAQRPLMDALFTRYGIGEHVRWYYTPMAVGFTRHLPRPLATVYDCMDELSAFRGAPPGLILREAELFQLADLVFTGGQSLYEAKRRQHPAAHPFPSSVDAAHFAQARVPQEDPADQAATPHPRLGFFGVVDERLDVDLLAAVADLRRDWQLVVIGPVAKIDPASLPQRQNIHYLGGKSYTELPRYLAGWDVAMMPFARNEATRFISPTKTPEYLAAGRPVVSTSIRDVVRPYGDLGLARIADEPADFVAAVEAALGEDAAERLRKVEQFLAQTSWDRTWSSMDKLIADVVDVRRAAAHASVVRAA